MAFPLRFSRGDLVPDCAVQPLWDRVIDATDNAKKKGALFSMDNAPRVMQDGPIKVSNLLNVPIIHRCGIFPRRPTYKC